MVRTVAADPAHLGKMIEAAARHKGTSFVEITQNCLVFNDRVLESFSDRAARGDNWVYLEHGQPIRFGTDGRKGIVLRGIQPEVATVGENGVREEDLLVHDVRSASVAHACLLASLAAPNFPTALGVFRQVEKPTYDELLMAQIRDAVGRQGRGELPRLLNSGTIWLVD